MSDAEVYALIRQGGPRLAELVDTKFHTRSAFARRALISVSDASRFCSGKRKPPPHVVPRIGAALGVPLPDVSIPKDAMSESLDRALRVTRNALNVERHNNQNLELQLATCRREKLDLLAKLDSIRKELDR